MVENFPREDSVSGMKYADQYSEESCPMRTGSLNFHYQLKRKTLEADSMEIMIRQNPTVNQRIEGGRIQIKSLANKATPSSQFCDSPASLSYIEGIHKCWKNSQTATYSAALVHDSNPEERYGQSLPFPEPQGLSFLSSRSMSLMDQPLIKSPTHNIGKSSKSSPLLQSCMSPMTPINDCLFNPFIYSVGKNPEPVSESEQYQFNKSRENKKSSRRVHKVSMLRSKPGLLDEKCALLSPYSSSSTTSITEKSYSTHSQVNDDRMLPISTSDRLQPSSSKPNAKSLGSRTLLNGYQELFTISPHFNQIGPLASREIKGFVNNSVDDCSELFCTCPKSRCLKLYCVCFQRGLFCDNIYCKCIHCKNKIEYNGPDGARKAAITSILRRRHDAFEKREKQMGLGCNCRRNKCLKKYCACFSEGTICTYQKCGCLNCHNNRSKVRLTSNSPYV